MKWLYTIALVFGVILANAQGISLNPKTINVAGKNNTDKSGTSIIKNESTDPADTMFTWNLLSFSKPMGWVIDFCDPYQCYSDINGGTTQQFKLAKGESSFMKADFYFNELDGSGSFTVVLKSKLNPSNADTLVVNGTAWVTAVKELSAAKTVKFFPNPAKNNLTINTTSVNGVTAVKVLDITGKEVLTTTIKGGMETALDVSSLNNGVYFVHVTVNGSVAVQKLTISK